MKNIYPYNDALNDLSFFFKTHVKNKECLENLNKLISVCRNDKSVAARQLNHLYFTYRKEHHDYTNFTKKEEIMWDDVMHFWG